MQLAVAFITGLIFGLGLILAGMANPEKVLAFLDITGQWDPSLALVMVGAIAVATVGFAIAKTRTHAICGTAMQLPSSTALDKRLLLGALGFGIGWGLAGFCPGPALVALGTGAAKAIVFAVAMIAGMILFEILERAKA